MRPMPPLLDLREELFSGMEPLNHPHQKFVWEYMLNIRNKGEYLEPASGFSSATHTGAAITWPFGGGGWNKLTSTSLVGLIGDSNNLYKYETTLTGDSFITPVVTSLATGLGGTPSSSTSERPTCWSAVAWGTYILATAGISGTEVYRYTGPGYTNIAGSETPKILAVLGPHVLGFNYISYGGSLAKQTFRWCSADDELTWTPLATNSAGDVSIREFTSEIVAVAKLGDKLAVFSETQMAIVSYVGAPYYFGYEIVLTEVLSVSSRRGVVTVGDMVYGWGMKGFFRTNGNSVEYFGHNMHKYIRGLTLNLTSGQMFLCHLVHDLQNSEIQFSIPFSNTSLIWFCAVYNYQTDSWYMRTNPSSVQWYLPWIHKVVSGCNGYLALQYPDNYSHITNSGSLIPEYIVQSKPFEIKADISGKIIGAEFVKFIQSVRLDISHNANKPALRFAMAFLQDPEETPEWWLVEYPFERMYPMRSARYIQFKIFTVAVGYPIYQFRIEGIQLCGKVLGNLPRG